jgi:hypothetical protein
MGLLDIGAKILMTVRADTSNAKAELKSLAGEEKKIAQERLKHAEDHNKGLEDQIKRIGRVTMAIGTAGAIIASGRAGFQAYERESRLTTAAAGANLSALSKAAGGLATRMELLEFAAKAQSGAFKLSNEQMATAQKAILAITRAGYDHADATKKVTDALVKLEGDGLKDFGIRVREAKTDTEKFAAVMDALAGKAADVDGTTATAAESVSAAGVKFQDAFDTIKTSIGEMVVAMGPLIEGAAELASVAARLTSKVSQGYSHLGNMAATIGGDRSALKGYGLTWDEKAQDYYRSEAIDIYHDDLGGSYFDFMVAQGRNEFRQKGASALMGGFQQFGRDLLGTGRGIAGDVAGNIGGIRQRRGGGGASNPFEGYSDFQGFNMPGQSIDQSLNIGKNAAAELVSAFAAAAETSRETAANTERLKVAMQDAQTALGEYEEGKRTSFLEKTFGKLEEFDAYATAFQGLTSGVVAGYNAMVDGSMSFGQAFKLSIANTLKSTGSEMLIMALKETAYGFAALAWPGGQVSAASHFKSAALFGAGAVAAGVAANALGTGGGSGASAAAGARSYASGGSSSSGGSVQEPTRIIVYADAFAEDSERGRRATAQKIVARAYGSGAVENN